MKLKIIFVISVIILTGFVVASENNSCSKIYFLVTSTNYAYTNSQLSEINATPNEVYNYSEDCKNSKYPVLPRINAPILFVKEDNNFSCDYSINSGLWSSIPIFKINLGDISLEGRSCGKVQTIKYFFKLDKVEDNYSITGIPPFPYLMIFIFLVFIIFLYKKGKVKKKSSQD